MPKDKKVNTKQRRFEILGNAAAVLYARSYRWACLKCAHAGLEDGCFEVVDCKECLARYTVTEVHHVAGRKPLSPGIAPEKLFGPAPILEEPDTYVLPLEEQPVHLTATGYQWICVECDPWCERPLRTATALLESVCCRHCHAEYDVAEVRHWRGLPLTHRELTQHALRIHILSDGDGSAEDTNSHQAEPAVHAAAIL
ncbi:MAG: hypothetical protein DWQ07_17620 [Chloroflexi bacterium]|nr:MAG: hypothetical protein DWQ07_17620 [Chloroflexota bacterium]